MLFILSTIGIIINMKQEMIKQVIEIIKKQDDLTPIFKLLDGLGITELHNFLSNNTDK